MNNRNKIRSVIIIICNEISKVNPKMIPKIKKKEN